MSYKAWNGTRDVINVANAGTVSDAFSTPKSAKVLTIYFPAMTSVAASGIIEGLVPPTQDNVTEVWQAQQLLDSASGSPVAINDLIPAAGAAHNVTIPVHILGSGVFRIGGLEAQAAARVITLLWGFE